MFRKIASYLYKKKPFGIPSLASYFPLKFWHLRSTGLHYQRLFGKGAHTPLQSLFLRRNVIRPT